MRKVSINYYYDLYEDGSLYSRLTGKFIIHDISNRCGYIRVTLYKPTRVRHLLHRLVAEHFLEKIEGKNFVNHKDGNKNNNHYTNLEWVTQSENEKHAFRSGLRNTVRACAYKSKKFNTVSEMAEFVGITYSDAYNRCSSKYQSDYRFIN